MTLTHYGRRQRREALANMNAERDLNHVQNTEDYFGHNLPPIPYHRALTRAKAIQAWYPKHLLCGSVAMILAGIIPERPVKDIDFVTSEIYPNPNNKKPIYITDTLIDFTNRVIHFNIKQPYFHCLFLLGEAKPHYWLCEGLKIQDIDQMIEWKTKYDRNKDRIDLKKHTIHQVLSDELFRIDI